MCFSPLGAGAVKDCSDRDDSGCEGLEGRSLFVQGAPKSCLLSWDSTSNNPVVVASFNGTLPTELAICFFRPVQHLVVDQVIPS